jgi:ribosomal protein L11 methyltransferase
MEKKVWFSAQITVEAPAAEAVEFGLNEAGALGTEIDISVKREIHRNLKVVGYFEEKPDEESLKFEISNALRIYGFSADAVKEISVREVENQDWLAEWKKHWRPTETDKFIIAPTWEKVENTKKIIIRIEPSMAFGTGTHETTRLCLKAIEKNYKSGMSFLDVGTGTGILAIGAAKIQRKRQKLKAKISGCDTDGEAISIAKENASINDADEIEFDVGTVTNETPEYDFVCANLTADVILPLLRLLIEKTNRILVLSGILLEQEKLITDELRRLQVPNFKIEIDGEWISILIENEKQKE